MLSPAAWPLLLLGPALAAAASSTPTLYLCGDSTMAKGGNGEGNTNGWGEYASRYLSLPVVNAAKGGRSARSYTREGRFAAVQAQVQPGDYVVIEFGHNDGGSLTPTDNGRSDCGGTGAETCATTYDGARETVQTYYTYLANATALFAARGAHVVVASATPDNVWESGSFAYSANRFVSMAAAAANATAGAVFVDHGQYVADRYKALGAAAVDAYYPDDHTHTSPAGAEVVAQAFVGGLSCGDSGLAAYLTSAGKGVPSVTCE